MREYSTASSSLANRLSACFSATEALSGSFKPPEVSIFDRVGKGDTIGTIVNVITGSVEEIITADNDGIICSLREYPVIEEGSLIARILGGEADE